MPDIRQNQAEVWVKDLKRIDDAKPIGTKLCEALGLDPATTTHIGLECSSFDTVNVNVRSLVSQERQPALYTVLRQYKLVPIDGAAN